MIDEHIKKQGHTWKSYSKEIGEDPKNFKRKLCQNIEKINSWVEAAGLEVRLVKKEKKNDQ